MGKYIAIYKDHDDFLKELLLYRLRKMRLSEKGIDEILSFLGFRDGGIGEVDNKKQL